MILMIKIRVSPVGDNRYLNPRSRNIYFSLATAICCLKQILLLATNFERERLSAAVAAAICRMQLIWLRVIR